MKWYTKQRLFEVMEKVNPDFQAPEEDSSWAIFRIGHGGKCFITALSSADNKFFGECHYQVKYSDPKVLKFTLEEAKELIKRNISVDEKIGVVNNKGIQKLFNWRIKYEDKYSPNEILGEESEITKPKLILPVGISGSGKSTWIKSQIDSNTVVVSPDDIRRELTGSVSDQTKNALVFEIAHKRVADALNAGKNVIFDATNIKSRDRKSLMNYMKVHVDKPFEGFAKVFSVDPEIAKQRVKKDIEAGVDRSNVPDWAIDKQYRSFVDDMNSIELDGFKIIDNINEIEFKTSSDHFREINQMKHLNKSKNEYTPEEKKEIAVIIQELKKLGLIEGIEHDYRIEPYQDQMGTKTPRFEFNFYINKLEKKFGHSDIDNLLAKTNLDVFNPMAGSYAHGYIIRRLRLKQ